MIKNLTQANILKIAAMFVAAPRYIGLMLYLSGFVFAGWSLTLLHVAEGVAGLSLAVLEGFALAYILSRRQYNFSKLDKTLVLVVVGLLLLLLPLCATPYLLNLFDGTQLFVEQQNTFVKSLFKFVWAAGSVLMPVLVIIGVALVEKDPTDVKLHNAEREEILQQKLAEMRAKTQQTVAQIEAETEQTLLHYELLAQQARAEHRAKKQQVKEQAQQDVNKTFVCDYCGSAFESNKALAGHTGHCVARANGKQNESVEVTA